MAKSKVKWPNYFKPVGWRTTRDNWTIGGIMDDRTNDKTVQDRVRNSPWIKSDQLMPNDIRNGLLQDPDDLRIVMWLSKDRDNRIVSLYLIVFSNVLSDLTRFYKRRIWWIPKSKMKYSLAQFVMTSIWSKVEKWTHKSKLNKSEAHWQDS